MSRRASAVRLHPGRRPLRTARAGHRGVPPERARRHGRGAAVAGSGGRSCRAGLLAGRLAARGGAGADLGPGADAVVRRRAAGRRRGHLRPAERRRDAARAGGGVRAVASRRRAARLRRVHVGGRGGPHGIPHARVAVSLTDAEEAMLDIAAPALEPRAPGLADRIRAAPLLTRFPASLDEPGGRIPPARGATARRRRRQARDSRTGGPATSGRWSTSRSEASPGACRSPPRSSPPRWRRSPRSRRGCCSR